MTAEQSRIFADYILGMPDQHSAAEYVRFSAFRLDETFFTALRSMIEEARSRKDGQRQKSLDWLMSVASDACRLAYTPFAEAQARPKTTELQPQNDYSRAMNIIQIDKRVTAMMMRTHFNPVDEVVIADWKNIADEYHDLIQVGPPTTPLYTLESLRHKFAQSLESLASAYASMHDSKQSCIYYKQAAQAFDEAGAPAEAARCRSRLSESTLTEEARYDDQIRAALEELEHLDRKQPEYFSRLVDLGEFQAHAGDDFAAEKTLLKAEASLKTANWANPSGSDLAEALVTTLKGIDSGRGLSPAQNIATRLIVRGLHRRIHLALADIHRRLGDVAKADTRLKLAEQMDCSSPDDDFSMMMLNKLAGDWKNLFS
jgi:tetratricopeptide (TPR) repeat protein